MPYHLSVYVYYNVPSSKADAVWRAVRVLVEQVRAATGVHARLMRRRDEPDTWMEVYEEIADEARFEAALQAALISSGFLQALDAAVRHTERFVALELPGASGLSRE